MFQGIIFDLDGVLVHTDEMHYQAWKQIAERVGAPFDRNINNRLRGVARMDCMDIILEGLPPIPYEQRLALAEDKNAIYRGLLGHLSADDVDPDVTAVLNELRECGVKLAIGSSSKNAGFILEKTGLVRYFDAISDGNNITRSKPDPEVFLKAAEYLSLRPCECAVVEDAFAGVDAAKAGGFYSIGIGDASRYDKADMKISRFLELRKLTAIR